MKKLWGEIARCRMFLHTHDVMGGYEAGIEETPPSLVQKKNPDRSISTDMCIVADLRRVNLYRDHRIDYPVFVPKSWIYLCGP